MHSPIELEATSSTAAGSGLEILTGAASASDTQVRELKLKECKAAAYTLALAFANDEVSRYFIDTPDLSHWKPEQKWTLHLSIMEHLTYLHCLCGTVTAVGPNYDCVALWLPPGSTADSIKAQFRSGLWRLHYKLSREGRVRFFREFFPLLHDTKLAVLGAQADANSYYLVYIGTKPDSQGRGLARKCMEWGMNRADREGRLCYLESSNEVNLKIYSRMGFRVSRQIRLLRGVERPGCSGGGSLSVGKKKGSKVDHCRRSEETEGEGNKEGVVLDIMVREPVSQA